MKENYKSVQEAVIDLLLIKDKYKKVDLTSSEPSIKEARKFCFSVLNVIKRCGKLKFNDNNRIMFSETLKSIGCAKAYDINEKFIDASAGSRLGDLLEQKNIMYPIYLFEQIIDSKPDVFKYGMKKAMQNGEYSEINRWCDAQEFETEKTL